MRGHPKTVGRTEVPLFRRADMQDVSTRGRPRGDARFTRIGTAKRLARAWPEWEAGGTP